jgi:hypothetical protein
MHILFKLQFLVNARYLQVAVYINLRMWQLNLIQE